MEQRQPASVLKQFWECSVRGTAALEACPHSLLPRLLFAQTYYDVPVPDDQIEGVLSALRATAAATAAKPPDAADLEYANAITTFDKEVFELTLLPDVRECADPAAYRREALACLAKLPAKVKDLHREAERLARSNPGRSEQDHFLALRDAEHAAEAARRHLRAEAAQALAAVHREMLGPDSTEEDGDDDAGGYDDGGYNTHAMQTLRNAFAHVHHRAGGESSAGVGGGEGGGGGGGAGGVSGAGGGDSGGQVESRVWGAYNDGGYNTRAMQTLRNAFAHVHHRVGGESSAGVGGGEGGGGGGGAGGVSGAGGGGSGGEVESRVWDDYSDGGYNTDSM